MMGNKQVILLVRLIMIALMSVSCGTDDSQSYEKIEMSSQQEVFWEDEATTYNPTLAFELTVLPDYTINPTSNLIPLLITPTKYVPLAKDQTYFSTTDQITKFTTEKIVLVAKSETGLENSSKVTTTYSNVDKKGISSCQDTQAKNFDFVYWKNLTDLERSSNVLVIVLPLDVDLVEWFHDYDYNFRNSIASILNGRNSTSNSSEDVPKDFIEAGNIIYVAPTPVSNGTHISVCFMVKLKEESHGYLNATDIHPIIIKKQETLIKEFELPYLSVFIGCPTKFMEKCSCPTNDHMTVIISMTVIIAIIIIIIGYLHIRGHGGEQVVQGVLPAPDSPNESFNVMPCTSRTVVQYNRDMLTTHRHMQRGKRKTSFPSCGEHSRNRSGSRRDTRQHLPMVKEEHPKKGKISGDDGRIEVTFM